MTAKVRIASIIIILSNRTSYSNCYWCGI